VSSKNEKARQLYSKYGFEDSSEDLSDDTTHDKIMVCTQLEQGGIRTRLEERLSAVRAEPSKRARVATTVFDPADNMSDAALRKSKKEPLEAHESVNRQHSSQETTTCKRKRRTDNNGGSGKVTKRHQQAVDPTVGEAAVTEAEEVINRRANQPAEVGQYAAAVFEDDNGTQQVSYGLCVAMERRPLKPGTPIKPRKVTEVESGALGDQEVWLQCRWMRSAKHGNYRFNPTSDDNVFFAANSFLAQVTMMRLGPTCWKLEPEDRREIAVIMTARRYLTQGWADTAPTPKPVIVPVSSPGAAPSITAISIPSPNRPQVVYRSQGSTYPTSPGGTNSRRCGAIGSRGACQRISGTCPYHSNKDCSKIQENPNVM